ncbi:MAG TPA: IclR family transcriptional regulator [Acidobacteriaceae bacterium]|jgi:DNA-binding IclR family transcriptional regulator|nr:IclR family transcriptional regulator [Acidobacteriaceae bacterium]
MEAKSKANIKVRYTTPALEKGLDILELFASTSVEMTKSEVARRLGRTVSEVFRMLVCLEQRGYISRSHDEERFRLTLKLFKLAQEHPPEKRLIAEALPIMHQITHKLNQSCHLGVLDGGQVVILAQVTAPTNSGWYVKAGSTVDLMQASTGHVILAHQRPEICDRAIQEWQRDTKAKIPLDLQTHLAKIRQQGFEERVSYQVRGVINVSFPILDDQGYAMAAITVPFFKRTRDPISTKDVRVQLRQGSQQISEAVGGLGATPLKSDR